MTTKSSTRKDLLVHPDIEIIEATKGFERFLRVDVFRFRHRLFSGEWSAVRSYDVLRRGQAAGSCFTTPPGRASR